MNGSSFRNIHNSIDGTTKKKKLILHFDQHNTIQVACTLPGRRITVEEGLNNFLTSVVWGKEIGENKEWSWITKEPQMYKPKNEPEAITYFKYLEKKIVKKPDDRAELKKKTCKFVNEEDGKNFKQFFDLYLEKLTFDKNWNEINQNDNFDSIETQRSDENSQNIFYYNNFQQFESNIKEIQDTNQRNIVSNNIKSHITKLPPNTIPADDPSNKSLYHLILPDFFDMIYRLQREKRNFVIILRTMGIDSQNFLDTIKPTIEGNHRDFKDLKPMKINPNIGNIKRYHNDKIELEMDNQIFRDEEAIYKKLCSLEGINAIRDDFNYWQSNKYECYSAKPLWINLEDSEHHHILFDDNIRLDAIDDCIVNLRFNHLSSKEYENVDFESYKLFENCCILQPNLIELLNPHLKHDSRENHYLEKIRKAEYAYNKILAKKDDIKKTIELNLRSLSKENENNEIVNMISLPILKNEETDTKIKSPVKKKKQFIQINKPLGNKIKEEQELDKSDSKNVSRICSCI